jgi:hypothetical protein
MFIYDSCAALTLCAALLFACTVHAGDWNTLLATYNQALDMGLGTFKYITQQQ